MWESLKSNLRSAGKIKGEEIISLTKNEGVEVIESQQRKLSKLNRWLQV